MLYSGDVAMTALLVYLLAYGSVFASLHVNLAQLLHVDDTLSVLINLSKVNVDLCWVKLVVANLKTISEPMVLHLQ